MRRSVAAILLSVAAVLPAGAGSPWPRHVIDGSSRGADGVRLADFDGDGQLDIVTGWEEAGIIRLYFHPGIAHVTQPWPQVTVGVGSSPEDAVAIDLDRDGRLDILSCHEGRSRRVLVHWNRTPESARSPAAQRRALLDPAAWQSEEIEALRGHLWMFATPVPLATGEPAVAVASKGADASITLVRWPVGQPVTLAAARTTRLREAGWIMSLVSRDMDGDGDADLVYSDRKGPRRGVGWLEHPQQEGEVWHDHPIGGGQEEVLFLDADPARVLVATRGGRWLDFIRQDAEDWEVHPRPNPPQVTYGKAIRRLPAAARGGSAGLILTANTHAVAAERQQPGVWWLPRRGPPEPIDTPPGGKFDRIECLDLDGDGDADVLTCEERKNLGVIWYENPGH